MDKFQLAGLWRNPDDPEDETVGVLSFDPSDGFRLELPFGSLRDVDAFGDLDGESNPISVIHGTLRNGKCATLAGALLTNSRTSLPGGRTETYSATLGFIGVAECADDPVVEEARVRFSHLRDWVVYHPASMKRMSSDGKFTGEVEYRHEPIPNRLLCESDEWSISLTHTWSQSFLSVSGFHVDQDCSLILKPSEPACLSTISERLLVPLRELMSFCLDRHVHVQQMEARLAGTDHWIDVGMAQLLSKDDETLVHPMHMLLSLPDFGEHLAESILSWMSFDGDTRRAVSLLVALRSERAVPSDLRFLTAAQALEAMSRVGVRAEELSRSEFRRRLKAVRESVEDIVVREWAGRRLQHSNQRSSDDLLRCLLESIGPYSVTVAPDTERFLADHRANRNFYTHRTDRGRHPLLEPSELYVHTEGVLLLLKAAALQRMGFGQDAVAQRLNECQGCAYWRRRVAAQYAAALQTP